MLWDWAVRSMACLGFSLGVVGLWGSFFRGLRPWELGWVWGLLGCV